ncbi:hypothetical protein ACFZB9_18560 [Kitasatospora sp. NPDC008050]|uniref:hypothetical protein n=1 Tax=Kitasatospora sp. NPDC008050 TaxID=3364021 RepID=UPI0036EFE6DD
MTSRLRLLSVPLALTVVLVPVGSALAASDGSADHVPPTLQLTGPPADPDTATVLRPGANGGVTPVPVAHLRLARLDADGSALLVGGSPPGGPQSTAQQPRPGDVIVGPATGATPHGALVKVTAVHPGTDGSTAVDTVPATLVDALGDAGADLTVPLTAADISVKPSSAGGKVNTSAGQSSSPGVSFDVDVPMPPGVEPTPGHGTALHAQVDFHPELLFSYQRAHWYGVAPSKAEIGLAGDYSHSVQVHAQGSAAYDTGHQPLHIPAAEVNVDKTVWLGPVPIVLNLKVDYFYDVSADGKITVDAEEHTQGRLQVGARYDANGGWSALSSPAPTSHGSSSRISGTATAKAGIGSHIALGLYGSVGVAADTQPYLKATVGAQNAPDAPNTPNTPNTPNAQANWALYGGLDITGSFFAKLNIFGTTVLDKDWQLPPLSQEWKLAEGSTA